MVNVLLAASPATRSRSRAIKGQEPGLVDVLLQPPEQTRSRRGRAEVVNELLYRILDLTAIEDFLIRQVKSSEFRRIPQKLTEN